MPDFVAALITAAAFCAGLIMFNALTRWGIQAHMAPADLAENGLLQYGLAIAVAGFTWRRALATPPVPDGTVRTRTAG